MKSQENLETKNQISEKPRKERFAHKHKKQTAELTISTHTAMLSFCTAAPQHEA